MEFQSHRLIKWRAGAGLITLLSESAKTVLNMNSLIVVLLLGATVALAEIHVDNDPYRKHHHFGPIAVSLNRVLSFWFVANLL